MACRPKPWYRKPRDAWFVTGNGVQSHSLTLESLARCRGLLESLPLTTEEFATAFMHLKNAERS
jgi:hypothetical protein